jgi:DNA-binding ferritin-like protein
MSEEKVDVNKKIDDAEAAMKKYASKDTVISIGGYEFTPAKLMVAFTLVSSALGGLYGAFEVYKDYQGMKKKIADYVSPDLSEFDKRLAIIEQNQDATTNALKDSAAKTADYTRDIKNDLKQDIRRNESVTEQIERSVKQAQRESDQDLKAVRKDVIERLDRIRDDMDKVKRDSEAKIEKLNRDVDNKIQKAIDNPLAK